MCGPLHSHVRRRCIIRADGFYEGGEAKGSDVDLPEEPEAVRPGWPMGRVAQAEQEAGGVTVIMTEPNELDGLFTTACLFFLRPGDEEQWLDASRTPFVKAK